MSENQDTIRDQLTRIERCLVGDAEMGQLGLVQRMNNHANRIRRLELWVYRVGIIGGAATVVVGAIYKVVTDWWRH